MRNVYERLKKDHHLKHFGRLQLVLFLKVSENCWIFFVNVWGGGKIGPVRRRRAEMVDLIHSWFWVLGSGLCVLCSGFWVLGSRKAGVEDCGSCTLDPGTWSRFWVLRSAFWNMEQASDIGHGPPPCTLADPLRFQGIGLPLDEAIPFWRKMYGASMSDDKFNKEYKYNIRHSYGQEGRRANYPPKR
jgi:DNA primase large subunit